MKKIRVLIVEDSSVVRLLLELIVGSDPRLEVAGAVETAEEALRIVNRVVADGFEQSRKYHAEEIQRWKDYAAALERQSTLLQEKSDLLEKAYTELVARLKQIQRDLQGKMKKQTAPKPKAKGDK